MTIAALRWGPQYETHVQDIDAQHQVLFRFVGKFYENLARDPPLDVLRRVLTDMEKYANEHFALEEGLMHAHNYPSRLLHCAAHDGFRRVVNDFGARLGTGALLLPTEAGRFLRQWLSNHVLLHDKALGRFLRERGVP